MLQTLTELPDAEAVNVLLAELRGEARRGRTLQEAAQRVMDHFHAHFADSIVLARTYATLPLAALPERDQAFVREIATAVGASQALTQQSRILSLLGTAGTEKAWCDRYGSRSHLAIPLLSEEFVAQIPMLASLLRQLGSNVQWYSGLSAGQNSSQQFGVFTQSFFVRNAADTRDNEGRLVIPAQDFVRSYNVRTVFGVGGEFAVSGTILVCIFFSSDSLAQTPPWLLRLPLILGTSTQALVAANKIFDI